ADAGAVVDERSPLGALENPLRGLLRRANPARRRWPEPDRVVLARALGRRDGDRLCVRHGAGPGAGPARPPVPHDWAWRHRARPGAPKLRSLPRSSTRAGGRWAGCATDAGAARLPEHDQVSRLTRFPVDDAGPDHRAYPVAGASPRRSLALDDRLR